MSWLPSGENATEETELVCPCNSLSSSPVIASHTRTEDPEAIRSPPGENATEETEAMPRRCRSSSPVLASPTIFLPSENAQSNNWVVGIVSNGIVIVPFGSEIDGINPNRFLQFLQIDES